MEIKVIPHQKGLTVDFNNFTEVPNGSILSYHWDFGDLTESEFRSPKHIYETEGIYYVVLNTNETNSEIVETYTYSFNVLVVENECLSTLPDSIYNLIDSYLPDGIKLDFNTKRIFIEKWQLYLQPIVNHCINKSDFNNELKYDALENQLIMELALIDHLTSYFYKLLQSTQVSGGSSSEEGEGNEAPTGTVKRITTGPSEVEYFDSGTDISKALIEGSIKALSKGGLIDILTQSACNLAERLDIYLPMCREINKVVIPSITNRTIKKKFNYPNPTYPLNP